MSCLGTDGCRMRSPDKRDKPPHFNLKKEDSEEQSNTSPQKQKEQKEEENLIAYFQHVTLPIFRAAFEADASDSDEEELSFSERLGGLELLYRVINNRIRKIIKKMNIAPFQIWLTLGAFIFFGFFAWIGLVTMFTVWLFTILVFLFFFFVRRSMDSKFLRGRAWSMDVSHTIGHYGTEEKSDDEDEEDEKKKKKKKKVEIPFPPIPLIIRDVTDAKGGRIYANTVEPVELHHGNFEGSILLKLRTDPVTAHLRDYFLVDNVNRNFSVSVQGKVKEATKYPVYFGVEIPGKQPVSFSFFVQGIASMLLGVAEKMIDGLHSSWGDYYNKSEGEVCHVVVPLAMRASRFVTTDPGQEPPPFGGQDVTLFPTQRHDPPIGVDYQFSPDLIYSFDFHSKSLDFVDWKAVEVKGVGDMYFENLWQIRPMVLVAYELIPSKTNPSETAHTKERRKYLFKIEFRHNGPKRK